MSRYAGERLMPPELRCFLLVSNPSELTAIYGDSRSRTGIGNGGFYMSPPNEAYEIRIDSNGFQGRMSADAAGIAVCLFAYSQLSFEFATDIFAEHFHWLRDFAWDHPEAVAIFRAID